MASANVVALQNAVNRLAGLGNFSRVTVDGGLGPQTNTGVLAALGFIANTMTDPTASTATGLITSLVSDDGSINQTQIAQSAGGLATFIGQAADALGAPAENATVASGGGGSGGSGAITSKPAGSLTPAWATSLLTTLKALPMWQQIALGLATGLGVIWISGKIKHHNKRAA